MIPQSNPQAGYFACKSAIDKAIQRVLDSGWYILGQEVNSFEAEFASYCGAPYCVSCASGTDAIELALRALGIGRGDTVVTVPNTAVATVAAIERTGATPYFVDIDPDTYTISPNSLENLLKSSVISNIKVVIAVHLFGQPAAVHHLLRIVKKYHIELLEDCAQAHGATINGHKVGNFGIMGTFSFYPTKNLGALGDGGAIITHSQEIFRKLLSLRQYGWEKRYISSHHGINSRLDEIQAAILRVKLGQLDEANRRRQKIAASYDSRLKQISELILPAANPKVETSHVYHQYVIQTEQRQELSSFLRKRGIATAIHYPELIPDQPAYRKFSTISLPTARRLNKKILSLPMFPELTEKQVAKITDSINEFYR